MKKGEPPTKRLKEYDEEEERHGRKPEYDVFKTDLPNLRGRHELRGRSRG